MTTNWRRNVRVYTVDSVLNWFYIPIGVWVLIWSTFLSVPEIAMVYSISLFWSMALELPSGALADLIGRKKTVLFGRLANVLGYVVFLWADSFWWFVVAFSLYQTNWAMESGALSALVYDSMKENGVEKKEYQRTEARTFLYCTLGMAAASVIGGFLYLIDLRLPFYAMVMVSGFSLLMATKYQEPWLDTVKFSFQNWFGQNREGMRHIFRNEHIFEVSAFSVLVSFIGYTGLWYLYEPRLAAGGFDGRWMGILVGGTYLIRALGTSLIGRMERWLTGRRVPVFLVVVQMAGSALSYVQGSLGAISSVYARKFADGFRVPILANMQNRQIESGYRATSLSAISLLTNLLVAAAGPVIGWSNLRFGVPFTMGFAVWIGLVVGLPLAVRMARVRTQ
jgi:MFS family permease